MLVAIEYTLLESKEPVGEEAHTTLSSLRENKGKVIALSLSKISKGKSKKELVKSQFPSFLTSLTNIDLH